MNNEYLAWWVICYEILIVNCSLFIVKAPGHSRNRPKDDNGRYA